MEKDTENISIEDFYSFYRKSRPENFSDSVVTFKLTIEMFEFNLSELSANMKQDEFENFTRLVAIKLITPNLIPQTGPTGGGDGKTDIETHSVSEDVSVHWYVPEGGCHGEEKWAFAVSCKTEWSSKLEHDVKNIVGTNRGFTKILFFTNQLVKSKDKADRYDKYKNKYSIEVEIFDRNWFTQAVYNNGCYEIAIESLNLSRDFLADYKKEGPNDYATRLQLEKLDKEISKESNEEGYDTDYINKLLSAAILSRTIEEGNTITRGRFELALRECKKHGTSQKYFDILYNEAWTSFFWFHDPDEMYSLYEQLKGMLSESVNVTRIEGLSNIRHNLIHAIMKDGIRKPIDLKEDKKYFDQLCDKLEKDENHKSSFLFLKIIRIENKILYGRFIDKELNDLLRQLADALKQSNMHLDINLESQCEVFRLIGNAIGDNSVFDDLLDELTDILIKRKQGIVAARLQLSIGEDKLNKKDYVGAIKHIGQCIEPFQKEEAMSELVRSCGYLACAYYMQDLLYSSKVFYIKVLSLLFHGIDTTGNIDHLVITTLSELCGIELREGQIVNFLIWLELLQILVANSRDFNDDQYIERCNELDLLLSLRLMNCDASISKYDILPSILKRFGLNFASDAILRQLGYDDKVSKEYNEEMAEFSERRLEENDFYLYDTFLANNDYIHFETVIKGCRLIMDSSAMFKSQLYGELLFAFLESLISTASFKDIIISSPSIHFVIKSTCDKSEIIKGAKTTEYIFLINHKTINGEKMWQCCTMFLALFLSQNSIAANIDDLFTKKQEKEKIFNRLGVMMTYESCCNKVLGVSFKNTVEKWKQLNDESFPFKGILKGETNFFVTNRGVQASQVIKTIIDTPLWDEAKWMGVAYINNNTGIALCFNNIEYGDKILRGWKELQAKNDLHLHITFVNGVDRNNPFWYRVMISTKINKDNIEPLNRYVMIDCRFHTMQPKTVSNYDAFRTYFDEKKMYNLFVLKLTDKFEISECESDYSLNVPIEKIDFCDAWTIGVHEFESSCILRGDTPIIPQEHKDNAPILKVLELKNRDMSIPSFGIK